MPLEIAIEKYLVAEVKRLGGWAIKGCKVKGFPDRIVLLPGGRIWFVEVKNETGRLAKIQGVILSRLSRLGLNVAILYSRVGVDGFIEGINNGFSLKCLDGMDIIS